MITIVFVALIMIGTFGLVGQAVGQSKKKEDSNKEE